MLYSVNWQNFIIWLPLLLDILGNMCIQAFIQALFFLKDSVSLVFAYFSGSAGWNHGRHQRQDVQNLGLQIAKKCIFLGFFWGF